MRKNTDVEFWSKVNKTDDCWEWTGALTTSGYGRFNKDGKCLRAHRYSIMLDGRDPTDMYVCHHCDNRKCVRPDHLFLGTNQDNMDDMMRKGRKTVDNTYKRKLTDEQVRDIRTSSLSGSKLGKIYGLGQSSIWMIKNRRTYSEIA
jgi:hypothetical protein